MKHGVVLYISILWFLLSPILLSVKISHCMLGDKLEGAISLNLLPLNESIKSAVSPPSSCGKLSKLLFAKNNLFNFLS